MQSAVEDLKSFCCKIVTLRASSLLISMMSWTRTRTSQMNPLQQDVIGLHGNHITKRLKSWVNRFFSFVNVKVIFQNTRRIKSFLPYRDCLNRSQLSKVICKLVAGTAMICTLGKRNEDFTTGKRNISRPFRNVITLLLLLITLKQLVTTSNGTILALWRPAKLTTIVRLRRPCLFRSCSQH